MTDLLQAVKLNQIRMIELMVQIPDSVTKKTLNDALIMAVKSNSVKIMELLLDAGADANTKDKLGNSVLSLTTSGKTTEATNLLLDYGAECNDYKALHNTAKCGNDKALKRLLDSGAKVDMSDSSGLTALMTAAKYTQSMETICGLLLDYGASVNQQDRNLRTALHYAILKLRGIETLVLHGARHDLPDDDGSTPLMYAATEGLCSIVRVLMKANCDVNVKNSFGKTAMHILAMKGHACCVRELLRHGGDVNVTDDEGRTPLDEALAREQLATSRLLLQYNGRRTTADAYATELLLNGNYELVKMLVRSGADTTELGQLVTSYSNHNVDSQMVTWLSDVIDTPRTLLEMTRFKIRKLLGADDFCRKCDILPLPKYLKDVLHFIDLDHFG